MPLMWGPARLREFSIVAGLSVCAAVVYGLTLCPTVHWYDSAEFSASAATLRVAPHPPGYPLYTLIGHVFTWLPFEAALGMNVMSAFFGVAATVVFFGCLRKVDVRPSIAGIVAATLAVCPTLWANAVKAEVYTPGLTFSLGTLWLCLVAVRRADVRYAWAAAGVAGLGLGMHMSIATLGVAYALLVASLCVSRSDGRWKLLPAQIGRALVGCALAVAIGGSILFAVPLGLFDDIAPLGDGGDEPLRMWLRGLDYIRGGVFRRYFHAFPLLPRLAAMGQVYLDNVTPCGVALGGWGLVSALRRTPWIGLALLGGVVGNATWFFAYDVPDLDVFLLPGIACFAVLIGLGAEGLCSRAEQFRPGAGVVMILVLLAIPCWLTGRNWRAVDLSQDRGALQYGHSICDGLPPNAVLAMTSQPSEWERYTVSLYMHETKQGCEDVEFWGAAYPARISEALAQGRPVFAFIATPRFAGAFDLRSQGGLFAVTEPVPAP